MEIEIFGKRLRKITEELVASAVIVSFIESYVLMVTGFLKVYELFSFLAVTGILAIIEILLVFVVEELLVAAKHRVRKHLSRKG